MRAEACGTPFFPASMPPPLLRTPGFAFGLENSALLRGAADAAMLSDGGSPAPGYDRMPAAVLHAWSRALQPLDALARRYAGEGGAGESVGTMDGAASSRREHGALSSRLQGCDADRTQASASTREERGVVSAPRVTCAAARPSRPLYLGIDTSVNPSLRHGVGVADAYDALSSRGPPAWFGAPGTLALTERITSAIRDVPVRQVGYRGVMMPVAEDHSLAGAMQTGRADVVRLLAYSAVCGVGIDTLPCALPAAADEQSARALEAALGDVAGLILDVAALARRLVKPLSMRLLPIPHSRCGDRVTFDNPHLVPSATIPDLGGTRASG